MSQSRILEGTMTDRRVRKIKIAIIKALEKLLREKDFHDIAVTDIADRADIVKTTFYNHYNDKFDLVRSVVLAKMNKFYQQFNSMDEQVVLGRNNLK